MRESTFPSTAGVRRTRVVVADDQPTVRHSLDVMLRVFADLDLVGEAADGAEALRLCAAVHPDVVLMDVVMPGMGGIAATRAIRDRFPQIQVIAMTSLADEAAREAVLQAGAQQCLSKSVSIDELAAAVRRADVRSRGNGGTQP